MDDTEDSELLTFFDEAVTDGVAPHLQYRGEAVKACEFFALLDDRWHGNHGKADYVPFGGRTGCPLPMNQ
jgi:hypothetical protein